MPQTKDLGRVAANAAPRLNLAVSWQAPARTVCERQVFHMSPVDIDVHAPPAGHAVSSECASNPMIDHENRLQTRK